MVTTKKRTRNALQGPQRLRKANGRYVVTIPDEEVANQGIEEGDLVFVTVRAADVRPRLSPRLEDLARSESAKRTRTSTGISRAARYGVPNYLTLLDVVAIHERVMRAGGYHPRPLLRPDLLESALYRPQQAAYYEEADIIQQAALLAVAISEAQAFEDGNKTTAFACLDLFLRENGYLLLSRATRGRRRARCRSRSIAKDARKRSQIWRRCCAKTASSMPE